MLQLAYFYSKFSSCWIICALGNTPFWGQKSVLGNIIALRVGENKYLLFFFFSGGRCCKHLLGIDL